jgi:16S rRNA (guanine527-N7)-methyltransferase
LNESEWNQLQRVCGDVSRETFDRLTAFRDHFVKWNARINLVAGSTLGHLWERHILDSAQLIPLAAPRRCFLDLGSGGGFPGLVVALMAKDRPGAYVDLVESNRKKAAFLADTIQRFGLPAKVHACRIEDAAGKVEQPGIVTARALTALGGLLGLAEPWLSKGATGLFHKGRDYRREIEESREQWDFILVEHKSKVDRDGVILEIAELRRKV